MAGDWAAPAPAALPILAAAQKHLRPVVPDDVYREFTYVSHAVHSCPLPPDAGSETVSSRFRPPSFEGRIRCRRAYDPPRVRVMGHPVTS